ncbi:hypothetical protein GCM10011387_30930 [Pedobacter quisquiliarum]|jgi:hypothetical protein|uniref:Uncharacterized protein n=1 Tax=Pedobacter quisquiliarum TaxID=1834438 RepID=A0A916XI67_9SPHI|nr:hypothetical protein [Pedobacter quisquiliarum]GGC75032.1 hypothetical protein GCM10011387_30930 [Pedobacter quisquiliarum]
MMMNLQEFKSTLSSGEMPENLSVYLQALWYDGRGDWKAAHDLIDQRSDKRSAHLHAYLHRKEGDIWNADYWYNRAGEKRPAVSLEQEWEQLVQGFLAG